MTDKGPYERGFESGYEQGRTEERERILGLFDNWLDTLAPQTARNALLIMRDLVSGKVSALKPEGGDAECPDTTP